MPGQSQFELIIVVGNVIQKSLHIVFISCQGLQVQLNVAFVTPIVHILQPLYHPLSVELVGDF